MKLYLFDYDKTLNLPGHYGPGPIDIQDVIHLRNQGHAVGLMGDWQMLIKTYPDWWKVFCMIAPIEKVGPIAPAKAEDLSTLKRFFPRDWEIIMVGNIPGEHPGANDNGAARLAGVRFIRAADFAVGRR